MRSLTDLHLMYHVYFFSKENKNPLMSALYKVKTSNQGVPLLTTPAARLVSVYFLRMKVLFFLFQSAQSKFPPDLPHFIKAFSPLKSSIKRLA